MSNSDLGHIKIIDARELWKDEARDFTLWLAENAQQLSEAIGIPIEIDSKVKDEYFAWLMKHLMIMRKMAREVLG
ncbi:MAG: hypothetical protein K9I68_03670 [Bacteroidales bacterium]|nr:hypothetical protein [Bacteroidales bacterium]MCF8336954.1 hypothetical protein [Bacteroidales bacterium]